MGLFDFFKKNGRGSEDKESTPKREVKITAYSKSDNHMSFSLAGTNFCTTDELDRIQKLKYAEELVLIPEPDNIYDPNAILVKTQDDVKIGYIPKAITFELREPNDKLKKMRCIFTKNSEHTIPFVSVYIEFL